MDFSFEWGMTYFHHGNYEFLPWFWNIFLWASPSCQIALPLYLGAWLSNIDIFCTAYSHSNSKHNVTPQCCCSFWWLTCRCSSFLVGKLYFWSIVVCCSWQVVQGLKGDGTHGWSNGFMVILFHGQIVPSQINPLNSQIIPQNCFRFSKSVNVI